MLKDIIGRAASRSAPIPIQFLDNGTLVETGRRWCLRSAACRDGDPVWTSDAMLDSGWFGVVPIFVRSGGVPVTARMYSIRADF